MPIHVSRYETGFRMARNRRIEKGALCIGDRTRWLQLGQGKRIFLCLSTSYQVSPSCGTRTDFAFMGSAPGNRQHG
jgi:hypothetical protein